MNALTPLHMDIFRYIAAYIRATGGISPTQREIARRFRYKGVATIHGKMNDLRRAGMIDWMFKRERSISITQPINLPTPAICNSSGAVIPLRLVPIDGVPA